AVGCGGERPGARLYAGGWGEGAGGGFEDRVAIVTGAAKGMGGTISAALAAEGAHLGLAAREPGPLAALAEDLKRREGSRRYLAVPTDVTDERAVAALARR